MAVSLKKSETVDLSKLAAARKLPECTPVHLIDEEETIKNLSARSAASSNRDVQRKARQCTPVHIKDEQETINPRSVSELRQYESERRKQKKWYVLAWFDEAGNWIWRAFTDEDGDGVPDDPENPFREWDEEPEDWDPFDPVPDTPVIPDTPTDTREVTIIFISADGTMTVYDESGELKPEDCDKAYSMWVSENGIMEKKLDNYSVTEGLLALVLLFTVINFVRGLFRRKDIYR